MQQDILSSSNKVGRHRLCTLEAGLCQQLCCRRAAWLRQPLSSSSWQQLVSPLAQLYMPLQARLLVDKAHMGSIMGRGGTAVADMRKSTGANIKIISDEALKGTPGCERVHIFGDPTAVRAALEAVSAKLKTAQSRPGGNQQACQARHQGLLDLQA